MDKHSVSNKPASSFNDLALFAFFAVAMLVFVLLGLAVRTVAP